MKKNLVSVAVGSAMLLGTTATLAAPFNSFDPKTMAMGGAGVAVANPGSAPFFNPALLSIADKSDDFALELPIIGARAYDPEDFGDAIDNFDDTVVDNLDTAIQDFNTATGNTTDVRNALSAVDNELLTLNNKPFQADLGAGMVVGIPSKKFGMAFSAAGTVNVVGVFNYEDSPTIAALNADLQRLDDCAITPDPTCTDPATYTYVDAGGNITFTANDDTGSSDLNSQVHFVGIALAEVGLSFSREMSVFGSKMAVGLTPKYVSATVFDYEANADNADSDNYDADDYTEEYTNFNLDIGLAKDYRNGWRTGFVVKNIISQDYEAMYTDPVTGNKTPTGVTVSLKPQARFGISRTTDWTTLALDVDLTENEALGLGDKSRYVALGAEFNAFRLVQLRAGYRADTVNSDRSVASLGVGFSPLGIHMDLGVAGNDNEVGGSFQLGFRF